MKYIFATFLAFVLISSVTAFAGGQIGSGGNGCTLRNGNWKSVEELIYPEMFTKRFFPYKKPVLPINPEVALQKINLSDYRKPQLAFRRLERLATRTPRVHKALTQMARMFDVSYIVNESVEGLFEGDITFLYYSDCISYTPAVMTFANGTVVFFSTVWNKLSEVSAEVILIHEVLRLAQMFHPAFEMMDNWELQIIASRMFDERTDMMNSLTLDIYEKNLAQKCVPVDGAKDFKYRIQKSICSGNFNPVEINKYRRHDLTYRNYVERNLAQLFFLNTGR